MTSAEYLSLPEPVKKELYFRFMTALIVPNKMKFVNHCQVCEACFARLNEKFAEYLGNCALMDEPTAQKMMKASLN